MAYSRGRAIALVGLISVVAVLCFADVGQAQEAAPAAPALPGGDEGWVASDGRTGVATVGSLPAGAGIAASPGLPVDASHQRSAPPATSGTPEFGAQESVIDSDDRSRVYATTTYPSRAIGQLAFRTPTGGSGTCTGWLVSTRLVLTSGHCVHNSRGSDNGWYSQMRFYPGRNGSSIPYGSCSAGRLATLNGWFDGGDPVYDLGAIRLNCSMGSTVGWLGFVRHSGLNATTGMAATVRGYPDDRSPSTMWTHSGSIARSQTKSLFYRMDTAPGQSGAPVFAYQDPPGTSVTTGEPLGPGYYGLGVHGWARGGPATSAPATAAPASPRPGCTPSPTGSRACRGAGPVAAPETPGWGPPGGSGDRTVG